jgi:hypothetical protein
MSDGRVLRDATVDEHPAVAAYRREHARYGGAGHDCAGHITAGENHLLPAAQVGGDQVQLDARVEQVPVSQIGLEQAPQRLGGEQRGTRAGHRQDTVQRPE